MGVAKQQLAEHEDRIAVIQVLAIEAKAIAIDEDDDETSSLEDPDADKQVYADAFQAWADDKIAGTADDIFEAVKTVLGHDNA